MKIRVREKNIVPHKKHYYYHQLLKTLRKTKNKEEKGVKYKKYILYLRLSQKMILKAVIVL